jgi:replicative DNA helicase
VTTLPASDTTGELIGRSTTGPASRVPPNDLGAERAVLGSLMIDQAAIAEIRDVLEPEDFYAERHAHIYRAAVALADRGDPIDEVTLQAQLERGPGVGRAGGVDYISELTLEVPTAASVRHWGEIVINHSLRRRLISAGGEVTRMGFDNAVSAVDAIETAEQKIFAISQARRGNEATHIAKLVHDTWEMLEERLQKKDLINGVRTNFPRLDGLTQGLQPQELVILAARPSVGKTSLALNIARNAAVLAKVPVAIFSLEMSRQALAQRLICSEAQVNSHVLRSGQASQLDFQRIAAAMDKLTQAELWIDDTPRLSIATLRARARRMKSQHNIGLVIIDYLQLMHGGRQESRVQEVSDISSGLKAVAKELDVPVMALSQLSRASEQRNDKRPQLSDLRDSGSIEQDADVVLFLYREGMHKPEIDKSRTELIVAKNRNGPTDDIELVFVAEQTTFREPYPHGE